MATHIGHLDRPFHQLTNIQGRDEANENGQKKDLILTGDIFKICRLLASITKEESTMQSLRIYEECQMKMEQLVIEL
jgi:hypothetical protein